MGILSWVRFYQLSTRWSLLNLPINRQKCRSIALSVVFGSVATQTPSCILWPWFVSVHKDSESCSTFSFKPSTHFQISPTPYLSPISTSRCIGSRIIPCRSWWLVSNLGVMLSLLHLEGGFCTLMVIQLSWFWWLAPQLPSLSSLSISTYFDRTNRTERSVNVPCAKPCLFS